MLLNRPRIIELNSLLCQLLSLNDSDFLKFLTSDASTVIKPFINCLHAFWSSFSSEDEVEGLDLSELIFKFLLRLCPSFNSKLIIKHKMKNANKDSLNLSAVSHTLKAVICPKKFIDSLFDVDPLGLLIFLYANWNENDEYLEIIREELIPQFLIQKISKLTEIQQEQTTSKDFLEWITKTKTFTINAGDSLKNKERESIIKRFEYESDDDYFEGEDSSVDTNLDPEMIVMNPIHIKLFNSYIANPSTFSRTKSSRSSPDRQVLINETKLSHEQLEGWALMLERNPKKSRIIQDFIISSKINAK